MLTNQTPTPDEPHNYLYKPKPGSSLFHVLLHVLDVHMPNLVLHLLAVKVGLNLFQWPLLVPSGLTTRLLYMRGEMRHAIVISVESLTTER